MLRLLRFFGLLIIFLYSCKDSNTVFEDNQSLKNGEWYYEKPLAFEFEIEDTTKTYTLYYNVRNEISYPYYNLFVTYYMHYPDNKKIDSLLMDITLFNPKTGEPYGEGTGGIREHQLPAFRNFKFTQKGKYKYVFKQYMRHNPLKGILSMGLRVAYTTPEEIEEMKAYEAEKAKNKPKSIFSERKNPPDSTKNQ
ncbi:MAG: gliding motility lipoprotein GldH [Raineya sp.]|nr:gliding motility lipoprotein GldH [Raineya sp.]MDW8296574.1 gliding motility lipoprotein GldH [Raineya sp.]